MFVMNGNKYDSNWCLTEETYDPEKSKHYEGLFTQGNGYMDVRGSYEEGLAGVDQAREYERKPANVTLEKHLKEQSNWGTYIPGIVGKHPHLMTEIINLPYFFETGFCINGETLDMNESKITGYKRWLDMRDGSLNRHLTWHTKNGQTVEMEFFRFISKENAHLAISQIKLKLVSGNGEITFFGGANVGVRTNGFNHFTGTEISAIDKNTVQVAVDTNGGNKVVILSKLLTNRKVATVSLGDEKRGFTTGTLELGEGEELVIQRIITVATDRDKADYVTDPFETCAKTMDYALETGCDVLLNRHQGKWFSYWNRSDVIIEGDDRVQKALRMSIYHLLRADNDRDDRVAICAKGYAGAAYFGRYFWDTEISLLPFFIYTNPEAAKKLLMFRYNTLAGAKRNAHAYGYKGARYPWESSVTGDEECANWQYADHEVHVTADIVYAIMHYVHATEDVDFIRKYGIDIMVETARYWCTRVDKFADGSYQLLGVMGPDEYLPITSNNRYTNKMVKYSLEQTIFWLEQFRPEHLNVTDEEIAMFKDVASNLKLELESPEGIILQCDEFLNYADIDFDSVWKDRSKCFGTFISQERNYRSKALKQADVLEMMMLFRNEFTKEELQANYDYYEPITTHDSSLSAAVHGIIAAWLGKEDEALAFLDRVINIDMDDNKLGAEEGIHIANCGGLWQLIVFGFAGMKTAFESDEIIFEPHLPKGWKKIIIPIERNGEIKRYEVK